MDNKLIRLLLMYTKFLFLSFQEHFKIIVTLMIFFFCTQRFYKSLFGATGFGLLIFIKVNYIQIWYLSGMKFENLFVELCIWIIMRIIYIDDASCTIFLKMIKLDFIWTHYGEFEWAINAHKHILFLTLCAWYWLKIPAKIHFICLMFCLILS